MSGSLVAHWPTGLRMPKSKARIVNSSFLIEIISECYQRLNGPRPAHWLVDQPIGRLVVNEYLLVRVELQRPAQPQGDKPHVDNRTRAVPVLFVQGKFLPRLHRFGEICQLWRWIGETGEL